MSEVIGNSVERNGQTMRLQHSLSKKKDVPIRIATFLKMMDKYCCQIYKKKSPALRERQQ